MHASVNVAKEILERGKSLGIADITPMKLLKLVYIAHGWMLGLYGRPLVSEDVEAWQYGPVIPELYREIKSYKGSPIASINASSDIEFHPLESNLIDQVLSKYGRFSGFKLSDITHSKDTPWCKVWNESPGDVIPNGIIQDYYAELADSGN